MSDFNDYDKSDYYIGLIYILLFPICGFFLTGSLEGAWAGFLLGLLILVVGGAIYLGLMFIFSPLIISWFVFDKIKTRKRVEKMEENHRLRMLKIEQEMNDIDVSQKHLETLYLIDEIDLDEYRNRLISLWKSNSYRQITDYSEKITDDSGVTTFKTGVDALSVEHNINHVKLKKDYQLKRKALLSESGLDIYDDLEKAPKDVVQEYTDKEISLYKENLDAIVQLGAEHSIKRNKIITERQKIELI
jgi:hypothetical protein